MACGCERRGRERGRRHAEAGDEIDLVVDDQLLRGGLGLVRNRGVVLEDDLDLLAGDGVALLLHVELDRVLDLLAGRGLAAGHRQDQADLDGVLGLGGHDGREAGDGGRCCGPRDLIRKRLPFEHQMSLPFIPDLLCAGPSARSLAQP